jgi:hypothetical protein
MYAKNVDGPRSIATDTNAEIDPIEKSSANFRALITTTGRSINDCEVGVARYTISARWAHRRENEGSPGWAWACGRRASR